MLFSEFIRKNNYRKIYELLKKYPNFIYETENGFTPLHIACYYRNTEIIKLLLDHGADPNLCDDIGKNSMDYLFSKDNKYLSKNVFLLLEYGANPNLIINGLTILTHMCLLGDYETIELLLDYGACPNDVYKQSEDIDSLFIELVISCNPDLPDKDELLMIKNNHPTIYKKIYDCNFDIIKNVFIDYLPLDVIYLIHKMEFH